MSQVTQAETVSLDELSLHESGDDECKSTIQPVVAPELSTSGAKVLDYNVELSMKKITCFADTLSDEEFARMYEISKTASTICSTGWRRVALQFPDTLLADSLRVVSLLKAELAKLVSQSMSALVEVLDEDGKIIGDLNKSFNKAKDITNEGSESKEFETSEGEEFYIKLFILADTSYGECCVDEIAAEHADADAVIHYGKTCLSPTTRLPAIFVFTVQPLNEEALVAQFMSIYMDHQAKVILVSDLQFSSQMASLKTKLHDLGYKNLVCTSVVHRPSAVLPNRRLPDNLEENGEELLKYSLCYIGTPSMSLLLTLYARVNSLHVISAENLTGKSEGTTEGQITWRDISIAMKRRYGKVLSLSNAGVFGILINTLSVRNYLDILAYVKRRIKQAGKKFYTFVVGKLNPEKLANFSEIDGWVVIGCWESSLIDSKRFWKPLITPFELEITLQSEEKRIWTGQWSSDYQSLLGKIMDGSRFNSDMDKCTKVLEWDSDVNTTLLDTEGYEDCKGADSVPPRFDLRTGQLIAVSSYTPWSMVEEGNGEEIVGQGRQQDEKQMIQRQGNMSVSNYQNMFSPGAKFLRERTWKGLGTDWKDNNDSEESDKLADTDQEKEVLGAILEQGRSGIARGYSVEGPNNGVNRIKK